MAKTPDLTKFGLKELKALRTDIDRAIVRAEKAGKAEALKAAEAAAQKMGFSLAELTGGAGRGARKKAVSPPRFRHPENPALTWSGRGRRPKWFMELLDAGRQAEDLAI